VVVANRPYGILDGLLMGRILSDLRGGDFKLMAHQVFRRAPELDRILLPIDFSETREAAAQNLATRAEALRYLGAGGAIGVFPGGTVSTAARPLGPPLDPTWRSFTAKMITRSEATVVPLFFEGHNSRLFQVASHLHYTLRLGLLISEFRRRVGTSVRIVVGEPLARERLAAFGSDSRAMMDYLRKATYDLSPRPLASNRLGHEFEARYRRDGGGHLRQRAWGPHGAGGGPQAPS
jgi:putative hemolysin